MPALTKPKWENMARNLARGMTQEEAYAQAGFVRNAANAHRLATNPVVLERVDELRDEREEILSGPNVFDPEQGDEGEQIAVTPEWVIERLAANVISAQSTGNHKAANEALQMLGQYLGMSFADKTQKSKDGESHGPALGGGNTFNILQLTDALTEHTQKLTNGMTDITPPKGDA